MHEWTEMALWFLVVFEKIGKREKITEGEHAGVDEVGEVIEVHPEIWEPTEIT